MPTKLFGFLILSIRKVLTSNQLQITKQANSLGPHQTVTTQLTDRLSVRIYKDCRPAFLEIGARKKGLF